MRIFQKERELVDFSPNEPVIAIKGLNHYFGTGELKKQVLYDIDLEIKAGEVVIMTGPSGSGKTTLLSLMGGLRSAQAGSLKILALPNLSCKTINKLCL
jgi:putative ABC transport system ATP-binding protein